MDKISKKSMKVSKKNETKLEKKVKINKLMKNKEVKNIDENLEKIKVDVKSEDSEKMSVDTNTEEKVTSNLNPINVNAQKSVPNKRIIIIKNINRTSKAENILSIINHKNGILNHKMFKVKNREGKSQMLLVEFKSSGVTDGIIKKLNGIELDGNILIAEYKINLVDCNHSESEIKTNTFVIRNLPLSSDRASVNELIKQFDVSQKNIQISKKYGKKCCFIKFNSITKASEAFELLLNEEIEDVPLDVKFVSEKKEKNENEFTKTKLHITNLPFGLKKEDIEKEFDMAQSIKFPLTKYGKSKGTCYLTFASDDLAALAFESFQDKVVGDRKIKCTYAEINVTEEENVEKGKKTRGKKNNKIPPFTVVTLFNLPVDVTQNEIISNFTNVKLVDFIKKGDKFKGIANIYFKDTASAKLAMILPEFKIKDRIIRKELKGGISSKKDTKSLDKSLACKDNNEPMDC